MIGGLHVCFNFLKVIGQHFKSSGLEDIFVEANILAANSASAALEGKAYYRGVRAHTLAYEALCRIKWQQFQYWLGAQHEGDGINMEMVNKVITLFDTEAPGYSAKLQNAMQDLTAGFSTGIFKQKIEEFNHEYENDSRFKYWSTYIEMVEVLLDYIKSHRDGNWSLHLEAFEAMLPWLTIYDHTNYARWGPIYLADMKNLPAKVKDEFLEGNFVIKQSSHRFNQVPIDQATEWVNRICKLSNGIIGITRNDTARDRFCATWSDRTQISAETKLLFGLQEAGDDEADLTTRKDALPSNVKRDAASVKRPKSNFKDLTYLK
jgi:hypothetical protein